MTGDNTYGNFTDNNQYYLYDSLRYTITKVDNIYDDASGTNLQGQIVYLDLNKSWDWKIKDNAVGSEVYFSTIVNESNYNKESNEVDVIFSADWTEVYS